MSPPLPLETAAPVHLGEAESICRRLARVHYENFLVGTIFLPPALRQPFYNLYAYCRTADDLADETDSPEQALRQLDLWEQELDACFEGKPRHPVFVALADTVTRFDMAKQPFCDLLSAFRQDQRVRQYQRCEDLLEYCRRSANPVGRMVLALAAIDDPRFLDWSDSICTALQLTNFCQDVRRDIERGRCYIPLEDFEAFGIEPADLPGMTNNVQVRELIRRQADRAEGFFAAGLPLADHVPSWLARDVRMFVAGGRAVLDAIAKQRYDVWERRPEISKWKQMRLMLRVALGISS